MTLPPLPTSLSITRRLAVLTHSRLLWQKSTAHPSPSPLIGRSMSRFHLPGPSASPSTAGPSPSTVHRSSPQIARSHSPLHLLPPHATPSPSPTPMPLVINALVSSRTSMAMTWIPSSSYLSKTMPLVINALVSSRTSMAMTWIPSSSYPSKTTPHRPTP